MAVLLALCVLVAASCGDDSDDGTAEPDTDTTSAAAGSDGGGDATGDGAEPGGDGAESGGGAGTLTFAGEEIALGAGRCFLEEQDAAAGGGSIELTGQASGTNAAGQTVLIDFTRFSEDSDFAGDDVSITIGDPFSEGSQGLSGSEPIGTVSLEGTTLRASDFPVLDFDTAEESLVSFEIAC